MDLPIEISPKMVFVCMLDLLKETIYSANLADLKKTQ